MVISPATSKTRPGAPEGRRTRRRGRVPTAAGAPSAWGRPAATAVVTSVGAAGTGGAVGTGGRTVAGGGAAGCSTVAAFGSRSSTQTARSTRRKKRYRTARKTYLRRVRIGSGKGLRQFEAQHVVTERDLVAGAQLPRGRDRIAVDARPVGAPQVGEEVLAVAGTDLGVVAADVAVGQDHVALR